MKQIIISSESLLDPRALTALGASTKRGDTSKIGMYGSGLKFTLPTFLRNKIPFEIWIDGNLVDIKTVKSKVQNTEFEFICVNGRESELTVTAGPDWQPWMGIREIYSNALDEANGSISFVEKGEYVILPGHTTFVIDATQEFDDLVNNFGKYFCSFRNDLVAYRLKEELNDTCDLEVYSKHNLAPVNIYRKGIRCFDDPQYKSVFDYNFGEIRISETRILQNISDINYPIATFWAFCTNVEMQRKLIRNLNKKDYNETVEGKALYMCSHVNFNDTWKWLEDIKVAPTSFKEYVEADIYLPTGIIDAFLASGIKIRNVVERGEIQYVPVRDKYCDLVIKKVFEFYQECGDPLAFNIITGKFKDTEQASYFVDRATHTCVVNEKAVKAGAKSVATIAMMARYKFNFNSQWAEQMANDIVSNIEISNSYLL